MPSQSPEAARDKSRTLAVVVIHGVGEQKPMATIRKFVGAVLDPHLPGPKYFSRPDRLSGTLELRKLQNREKPRIHYFEYYWASHVEGTTLAHITGWIRSLLFRRWGRVPPQLRVLWSLSWALLLLGIAAWTQFGLAWASAGTEIWPAFLTGLIFFALWGAVQAFLIKSLGDAARYLSPIPSNIKLRRTIRDEGLELLRKLHDAKVGDDDPGDDDDDPLYERIIIVGHSLGGVIAYDLVRQLWAEMNTAYEPPKGPEPPTGVEEEEEENDRSAPLPRGKQPALTAAENGARAPGCRRWCWCETVAFQALQHELWQELQVLGNPWRITDLITVGSPLAHAPLLLAADVEEFHERQRERELPTCPPVADEEPRSSPRFSYQIWKSFGNPGKYTLRAVHHGGAFGPTRWTNLYIPARAAFMGDPIGGPAAEWFGQGVRDLEVIGPSWFRTYTPFAHSAYWSPRKKQTSANGTEEPVPRGRTLALDALKGALKEAANKRRRPDS